MNRDIFTIVFKYSDLSTGKPCPKDDTGVIERVTNQETPLQEYIMLITLITLIMLIMQVVSVSMCLWFDKSVSWSLKKPIK